MSSRFLSTPEVCQALGTTEPALRHALRRVGAPRPPLHPTARIFLWTEDDVQAMAEFIGNHRMADERTDSQTEDRS